VAPLAEIDRYVGVVGAARSTVRGGCTPNHTPGVIGIDANAELLSVVNQILKATCVGRVDPRLHPPRCDARVILGRIRTRSGAGMPQAVGVFKVAGTCKLGSPDARLGARGRVGISQSPHRPNGS